MTATNKAPDTWQCRGAQVTRGSALDAPTRYTRDTPPASRIGAYERRYLPWSGSWRAAKRKIARDPRLSVNAVLFDLGERRSPATRLPPLYRENREPINIARIAQGLGFRGGCGQGTWPERRHALAYALASALLGPARHIDLLAAADALLMPEWKLEEVMGGFATLSASDVARALDVPIEAVRRRSLACPAPFAALEEGFTAWN